jgi:hypothetical protein
MTDRAQFEAMLEALINENHDEAKAIFHNIVVGKSREIYEELLSEDFSAADANKAIGGHTSEEEGEEEPAMEEADEEADDAEDDEMDMDPEADDAEDDEMDMDPEADDEFGGEEGGGDMEDRVMDLEDALEDLKAEFEQLMAGEEGEDHGDMGMDDMEGDMGMGDEPSMDGEDELSGLMEYVNKVGGATYNTFGKMGDNGQNTKSIVAGKNDMGGTSANIAKSFSTEKGGTQGGLANPKAGDLTSGLGSIHNRKDSNAGKTAFKKKEPGHGAEKKGAGEKADNTTSMLNGAPKRAK